jgi:predicted DNA-binding ribbon-helix-helix protein
MSEISKTVLQYKDFSQLQEYAEAQNLTIVQLSKKIQKLEDERNHLKKLLESSIPLIAPVKNENDNDSEYICTIEISKLRDISTQRELTLEESRRLETYFKILTQINNKPKKVEKEVEKLSDSEVLKLAENNDVDRK